MREGGRKNGTKIWQKVCVWSCGYNLCPAPYRPVGIWTKAPVLIRLSLTNKLLWMAVFVPKSTGYILEHYKVLSHRIWGYEPSLARRSIRLLLLFMLTLDTVLCFFHSPAKCYSWLSNMGMEIYSPGPNLLTVAADWKLHLWTKTLRVRNPPWFGLTKQSLGGKPADRTPQDKFLSLLQEHPTFSHSATVLSVR